MDSGVSGAVACAALLLIAGSCTDPGHGDRVDRGELASVLAQGFAEGYHSATATDVPNPDHGMAQRSAAVEEFMRRRGFSEVERKRALERIEALGSEEPGNQQSTKTRPTCRPLPTILFAEKVRTMSPIGRVFLVLNLGLAGAFVAFSGTYLQRSDNCRYLFE